MTWDNYTQEESMMPENADSLNGASYQQHQILPLQLPQEPEPEVHQYKIDLEIVCELPYMK